MIGIIITGHGDFSLGMKQAAEMIAGNQEHFIAVPFLVTDTLESFEAKFKEALTTLKQTTDEIVILSDLLGGTPFKTAVTLTLADSSVTVLAGTNLSMIIEGLMLRLTTDSGKDLGKKLVDTGKTSITTFEIVEEEESDTEGI